MNAMRLSSLADSIRTVKVRTFRSRSRSKILFALNAVGAVLAGASFLLVFQVDGIVHGLLYEHGLVFENNWAVPYWTLERLMIMLLGTIVGANVCSMYLLFFGKGSMNHKPASTLSTPELAKPDTLDTKTPASKIKKKEPVSSVDMEETGVEIVALPMVCKKCGKVFTQPLCMFDFKSGKPRLINVCPYCNAVLAVAGSKDK